MPAWDNHTFDNASLVGTLAAQAATVESARQLIGAAFRARRERHVLDDGTLRLRLLPYAVATIDAD